jgi:hypothetical protein
MGTFSPSAWSKESRINKDAKTFARSTESWTDYSPPQPRRGGRDIKKEVAKQPLMERTGWCWS